MPWWQWVVILFFVEYIIVHTFGYLKVPARAAAAAAVARALAALPPDQRLNLASSSAELCSMYGSKPHGPTVEELEEQFYEEVWTLEFWWLMCVFLIFLGFLLRFDRILLVLSSWLVLVFVFLTLWLGCLRVFCRQQWFKMWPIRDETAALERFWSWPNRVFAAIWNVIFAFKRLFPTVTETAIATETAFWITAVRS